MCTNYRAPTARDMLNAWNLRVPEDASWEPDVFKDWAAPIIRRPPGGAPGEREAVMARFRLIPFSAKDPKEFRASTMNARAETVDQLWSFKGAWARRQWCVIPAWWFYEPYYATADSKSVRWRIGQADGQMAGIAGIWDRWHRPGQAEMLSFAMITINCDEHPLLKRFHKWFDEEGRPEEKRTPVLLREEECDAWLNTTCDQARSFFKTFEASELVAEPAPAQRRRKEG